MISDKSQVEAYIKDGFLYDTLSKVAELSGIVLAFHQTAYLVKGNILKTSFNRHVWSSC